MKALTVLISLPALALIGCEAQKVEAPIVQAPVQEAKEMRDPPPVEATVLEAQEIGDLPLTFETLKVKVVKPDHTGEDAVWVEFQVKFSNKSNNYIALLNHPNSRWLELQNAAGKNVYPLIEINYAKPTPLDVVHLEPGEEKTLNYGSLAISAKDLGQNFKARMVFTPWDQFSMIANFGGLSIWQEWPKQRMEAPWQNLSTKRISHRNQLNGEPKVEFLGVDCVPQGDPDLKGIGFRAKYRITNFSPKTIVHFNRPDGLGFVVSGSKGEYANPYAVRHMGPMSVWDAVVLGPGESKLCLVSTPEYTEPGMEKFVKVKFSLSPWNPEPIEGAVNTELPNFMKIFPAKPIHSPVYEVERRL